MLTLAFPAKGGGQEPNLGVVISIPATCAMER
jgi:hypothetical protein